MSDIKFNLLEVDLTAKTSRVINVTDDVQVYLGGNGLGCKLVWDLVPQGADPLSPDNILQIPVYYFLVYSCLFYFQISSIFGSGAMKNLSH